MGVIAVTGWGLLAQAIAKLAHGDGHNVRAVSRSVPDVAGRSWQVDLTTMPVPVHAFEGSDFVVHTAAATDVVACERHPDVAWTGNVGATRAVVDAASEVDVKVVFSSTDWVFDGSKGGYREDDPIAPLNVYGTTKAAGEEVVIGAGGLVVRGAFIGARPDGRQGLRELLRGADTPRVARPRITNPLWVGDYARALLDLAGPGTSGVVHVGSATATTWEDLCRDARRRMVGSDDVLPAPVDDIARPRDSSLDSTRAAELLRRPLPTSAESCLRFADAAPMTSDCS